MNDTPNEIPYLQTAASHTIATEDAYVILCRPINTGDYLLEYVSRGEGKLISVVLVSPPRA